MRRLPHEQASNGHSNRLGDSSSDSCGAWRQRQSESGCRQGLRAVVKMLGCALTPGQVT